MLLAWLYSTVASWQRARWLGMHVAGRKFVWELRYIILSTLSALTLACILLQCAGSWLTTTAHRVPHQLPLHPYTIAPAPVGLAKPEPPTTLKPRRHTVLSPAYPKQALKPHQLSISTLRHSYRYRHPSRHYNTVRQATRTPLIARIGYVV